MGAVLSVSFEGFRKYAVPCALAGDPVMLRGDHGIGKSQGVYQLAEQLAWDDAQQKHVWRTEGDSLSPMPVVERRVSQMTEGDLLGIPDPDGFDVNGEKASKFRPFSWLVEACTSPVVLFLDELDRGILEVRQGFFEAADSRKIAGWKFHPGTIIVAAINGGEHGSRYQVNELGVAELDRWAVFDMKPTFEEWLQWGEQTDSVGVRNVHEVVTDFLAKNRDHLEHDSDFEPGKKYPSRRSWARLSGILTKGGQLEAKGDHQAARFIADAYVGFEAANLFQDFLKNYQFQVTPEDIIVRGMWKETKDWTINQHLALAHKFDSTGILTAELGSKQMKNFARWFILLPAEVGMKMVNMLGSDSNAENMINLYRTKVGGVNVGDHLTMLLTGVVEAADGADKAAE